MKNVCLVLLLTLTVGCASTNTKPQSATGAEEAPARPFTLPEEQVDALAALSPEEIHEIIRSEANAVEREGPVWLFEHRGVVMVVVADEDSDRVRIVAPIVPVEELPDPRVLFVLMEANFHTAQDARYATSDGVVYSAYVHPLSSLTGEDFRSALTQVSNLVLTFGTTFSGDEAVPVDATVTF